MSQDTKAEKKKDKMMLLGVVTKKLFNPADFGDLTTKPSPDRLTLTFTNFASVLDKACFNMGASNKVRLFVHCLLWFMIVFLVRAMMV